MSRPSVRVAFQGGGAKLAAMLPIADAFATTHNRDIDIKAVSGTFAGAICAALVAVDADFEQVRRHLVEKGAIYLSNLVPPRVARLGETIEQTGGLGWLSAIKNLDILRDIALRGQPVLREKPLGDMLRNLLETSRRGTLETFENCKKQCGIDLYITASNIVESSGKTHSSGNLVAAIVDSCSLPVLLRSFETLSESHFVDGGLCENLPVECLLGNHTDAIFAVFPKASSERLRIKNLLSYLSALMSASIGHSVKRSVALVAEPFRFEAKVDFDFLDFDAAIKKLGDNHWYESQRNQAIFEIQEFVKQYGESIAPNQARVVDVTNLGEYQKALSALANQDEYDLKCVQTKFIARVQSSLVGQAELTRNKRRSDTLTRSLRFEVGQRIPKYYLSNVKLSEEKIVTSIWSAKNLTRKLEIPIAALPLLPTDLDGQKVRECLIRFEKPDQFIRHGDLIEIQCTYHSVPGNDLSQMNHGKAEDIVFTNSRDEFVPEVNLTIIYPRRLGEYRILFNKNESVGIGRAPRETIFDADDISYIGPENQIAGLTFRNVPPKARIHANIVPT